MAGSHEPVVLFVVYSNHLHKEKDMSNLPTHAVYSIKDRGEDQKAYWLKIGSAWTNKDGSFNVVLDALPTDGKLHIRVPKPKDA